MGARETAERYIAAANDHDAVAMAALWREGGREAFPALGQVHVAPHDIRNHFRDLFTNIPDVRFSLQHIAADGARVHALSVMTGTHVGRYNGLAGTGRRFEILVGDFLEIEDDTITANVVLFDGLDVLRQLAGFPPAGSRREAVLAGVINTINLIRRPGRRQPAGSTPATSRPRRADEGARRGSTERRGPTSAGVDRGSRHERSRPQ